MNEINHGDNAHGGPNRERVHPRHPPYWKRAHRDWRFWIAAIFIFAAMIVYVLTVEFAVQPRSQTPPSLTDTVGK
jgi:hypothetical protein